MLDRAALILSQLMLAQESAETPPVDLSDTGRDPGSIFSEALAGRIDVLSRPESMKHIVNEINVVWASIFVIVGILCLLQGYRWHRWLIVILGVMAGARFGSLFGDRVGSPQVAGACLGVLGGVLAWPMMRYSVAVFGGLAGAFAGANIWTAVGQPAADHRIGALVGLIIAALLAFTAFRYVVIGLTTIIGATLLVMGCMAGLMQLDSLHSGLTDNLTHHPLIVPVVTGSAALFGVIFQMSGGIKGMAHHAQKAEQGKGAKPMAQQKAA